MTILILGFLTILIPTTLILWLTGSSSRNKLEWVIKLILVGNVTFLFFQIGPWAITSYYLRYAVVGFSLIGAIYSYWKHWNSLQTTKLRVRGIAGKATLVAVLVGLNTVSVIGQLPPQTSVSLHFPLKNGSYYLLQSGTTWVANLFHSLIPSGKYAVDIVKLNDYGNRAAGLFPPHPLTDYHIYGARLYSPCTGTVKQAVGSLTDNVPPAVDWEHRGGNYIVIACNGVEVTLLHLKAGSLKVSSGDTITAGQLIGMVGNSGYSDEPHLHIQANTEDGRPIPIEFDGKFLSTNDVYNN